VQISFVYYQTLYNDNKYVLFSKIICVLENLNYYSVPVIGQNTVYDSFAPLKLRHSIDLSVLKKAQYFRNKGMSVPFLN
jgi:hypothetical protein